MNGNQVESQIVYKVENGKFLQNHLKYNFIYDAQGRTIQKDCLLYTSLLFLFLLSAFLSSSLKKVTASLSVNLFSV